MWVPFDNMHLRILDCTLKKQKTKSKQTLNACLVVTSDWWFKKKKNPDNNNCKGKSGEKKFFCLSILSTDKVMLLKFDITTSFLQSNISIPLLQPFISAEKEMRVCSYIWEFWQTDSCSQASSHQPPATIWHMTTFFPNYINLHRKN